MTHVALPIAAAVSAAFAHQPSAGPPAPVRAVQPVQEYFAPFQAVARPADRRLFGAMFTHLGTDYGPVGPAAYGLAWEGGGHIKVTLPDAPGQSAGMWHSLAGHAADRRTTFDFRRCYPDPVKDEFQPTCRGVVLRAWGVGRVRVELKSADEQVLWEGDHTFTGPDYARVFDLDPAGFSRVKFLNWVAEPGANLHVHSLGLVVQHPEVSFPDRVFLTAYAKLARCAVPDAGLVKDQSHRPAGAFECVPASGMYALATAVAWDRGIVDKSFAEQTLQQVRRAVAGLPRADGWLPHFVSRPKPGAPYAIHKGTEYSTIDTSLAYHGLLLAARVLGDAGTEHELLAEIRALRFDHLRSPDGYLLMGFQANGKTPLLASWRDWGGEAALVVLLERVARGKDVRPKMDKSGRVPEGVGFVAEIQSLFYPHFDSDQPDALTGINWRAARESLARDQVAAVAANPRTAPAVKAAGLFGLSAGEGFRGQTYVAYGTRTGPADVLHPHYVLMAGQATGRPEETYDRVRALDELGLMPPWGLVENFAVDLSEYLPALGSLNAAFECLAAYHLAARASGRPNVVYDAARAPGPLADAVAVFYPPR